MSHDRHQVFVLTQLDHLRHDLIKKEPPSLVQAKEKNALGEWFGSLWPNPTKSSKESGGDGGTGNGAKKGIYIHGGVGCGKTMCMDMFYDSFVEYENDNPDWILARQKVHFHQFMLGIHKQMHEAKMVQGIKGDVLPRVIEEILSNGLLICFDEFQVTDVADALILRRLFTGLLERGAIVVATSNRPPNDLYKNGLQRDRFIPFILLLEEKLDVLSMWQSETDYRLIRGENKAMGIYFLGQESKPEFEQAFVRLTKNGPIQSSTTLLTTSSSSSQGRRIIVPKASMEHGIARYTFHALCRVPMGAADYLTLGQTFHTIFVEDIPILQLHEINPVRRFIVFVDVMYESRVKLIMNAQAEPKDLFRVDLDNPYIDEVFAFDRTRSRLEEMASTDYLKSRWVGSSTTSSLSSSSMSAIDTLEEEGRERDDRDVRNHTLL